MGDSRIPAIRVKALIFNGLGARRRATPAASMTNSDRIATLDCYPRPVRALH